MVFEAKNAYYGTEEQIDELSIQDQIDRKKLDITQLTKENLKKLKVDILHSNSHLRVRDENGKIIGKLKDNQVVDFNGEKKVVKYKNTQKVFLGINYKKGDKIVKAFISADYVKGNITKEETSNKPTTKVKSTPKTTPKKEEEIDSSENTPEEVEEQLEQKRYIFKDGRVFLIGEDHTEIEVKRELTKEEIETIKKYEKVAILSEIISIWSEQANKIASSLHWKSLRDDDEIILKQINIIEQKASKIFKLLNSTNINEQQINKLINEIFSSIQIAEDQEAIIGEDDMEKVKNILLSNENKDKKLIQIFNIMRYSGLSGNSATVKDKVANHLLAQKEYKDIKDILENKNVMIYVHNQNKEELNKIIKNPEITEQILEAYNKIKVKQEKNRKRYAEILQKVNKQRVENGKKEISLDDFINLNVDYSFKTLLKHSLIENHIEKKDKRKSEENSYEGIYANMSGLAENSDFDIFVISDDNIDTAIDIGATLALAAVSMGAGALAARGAMAGATYLAEATELANLTSKLGKYEGLAKFTATAGIEGYSFYVGTNTMHNIIYGEYGYNILKNNGNIKEISKSIALMGVLRGISKVMKEAQIAKVVSKSGAGLDLGLQGKALTKIADFTAKVPPLMFKQTSITGILVEAGILTGTSLGIEIAFEGEGEWSWEEYLQALVMIGLFKGISKVKFSKGPKGEIIADTTIIDDMGGLNGRASKSKPIDLKSVESKTGTIEGTPTKITELPRNEKLEITGKNGDQYEVTTNDTGSIIKVFNKTKNTEIKGGARSSWIKYNLENIRKKYGIETTETQTSSKQAQTEENVKTKEEPAEKKETEKANKKTEVNQNISEIQKEIDGKSWYKKSYEAIKEKYNNSPLEFINKEFRSFFNKYNFSESSLKLTNKNGETISISKDGKFYKVNNGNINYTKKDLFKEVITKEHKKNKLIDIAIKNIGKENISVNLDKPWYPFGKANIKIENGNIKKYNPEIKKYEDMPESEIKKFLEKNPKITKEIIQYKLEKIRLDTLDWKGISSKNKEILWTAFKNTIWNTGHLKILGFSSLFALYDVLNNKSKDRDVLLKEAIWSFLLAYVPQAAFGVIVIGYRAFKFTGGKIIDLGIKKPWNSKIVQAVWNNKIKTIIGGSILAGGIKIYLADGEKEKTNTPAINNQKTTINQDQSQEI